MTALHTLGYRPAHGVDDFVQQIAQATPLELVEIERHGVAGIFLKDLSRRMQIPATRMFTMLGVPKATAEKKSAAGGSLSGSGGQAAIGHREAFPGFAGGGCGHRRGGCGEQCRPVPDRAGAGRNTAGDRRLRHRHRPAAELADHRRARPQ